MHAKRHVWICTNTWIIFLFVQLKIWDIFRPEPCLGRGWPDLIKKLWDCTYWWVINALHTPICMCTNSWIMTFCSVINIKWFPVQSDITFVFGRITFQTVGFYKMMRNWCTTKWKRIEVLPFVRLQTQNYCLIFSFWSHISVIVGWILLKLSKIVYNVKHIMHTKYQVCIWYKLCLGICLKAFFTSHCRGLIVLNCSIYFWIIIIAMAWPWLLKLSCTAYRSTSFFMSDQICPRVFGTGTLHCSMYSWPGKSFEFDLGG